MLDESQFYVQKIIPLTLGLDPSMQRLGFSFTELLTGKPRWCGTLPIYVENGGWREHQLKEQMRLLHLTLVRKREAHFPVLHIGVEEMFLGPNAKTFGELADVAGQTVAHCKWLWPDAQIVRYKPANWRKKNDLAGNAKKNEVYARVLELGYQPPPVCGKCPKCLDTCGQDAADASLISRAAQRDGVPKSAARDLAGVEGAAA